MTREHATREAERIVAAIRRNSDDIHFDAIDWETFLLRSRVLWAEAEADPGIKAMVLSLLRNNPR